MTTSCTDWDHPYFKDISEMNSMNEKLDFFKEKNGKRMNYVSLGEFFDFLSYGGINFVVWDINTKGLAKITNQWINSQKPFIEYEEIPENKSGTVYPLKIKSVKRGGFLWNRFNLFREVELPRIKQKCEHQDPSSEKEENLDVIKDCAGRLRCGKVGIIKKKIHNRGNLTSDLYRDGSGILRRDFYEEIDYSIEKEDSVSRKGIREEEILNPCYKILKEPDNFYLPLQTVFDRLKINESFFREDKKSIFPFSGFTLANFVHAWANQKGRKRLYPKNGIEDTYRVFKGFTPVTSDD